MKRCHHHRFAATFTAALSFAGCSNLDLGTGGPVTADAGATPDALAPLDTQEQPNEYDSALSARSVYLGGSVTYAYDFGAVTPARGSQPTRASALLGHTGSAAVLPMYFFFGPDDQPLLGPLERDDRLGQFFMQGGQRPLVDRGPDQEEGSADYGEPYSGLWQIVAVKVPSGFEPNAIRDTQSLKALLADPQSGLSERPFPLAINCPLLESNQYAVPTIAVYEDGERRIPQPLVRLWNRKQEVSCLLVNGWETLGETIAGDTAEGDTYQLFDARPETDGRRVQTFDVNVGLRNGRLTVAAPLGLAFVPHVTTFGQDVWFEDSTILDGVSPRRRHADPPGYRPLRWLWNLEVNPKWRYPDNLSGYLDAARIDRNMTFPREPLTVRNMGLAGVLVSCDRPGDDRCSATGRVCAPVPAQGGHICQAPLRRLHAPCGPTRGYCRDIIDSARKHDDGSISGDIVETWFTTGAVVSQSALDEKVPADVRARYSSVSRRQIQLNNAPYRCVADRTAAGTCQVSCRANFPNSLAGQTLQVNVPVGDRTTVLDLPLDSRCGGDLMPGYTCDEVFEVCVRPCAGAPSAAHADALCKVEARLWYSDEQTTAEIAAPTTCQQLRGRSLCLPPL